MNQDQQAEMFQPHANLADEIAYYTHDLDDAVDFEILSAKQLEENLVWQRSHRSVIARF